MIDIENSKELWLCVRAAYADVARKYECETPTLDDTICAEIFDRVERERPFEEPETLRRLCEMESNIRLIVHGSTDDDGEYSGLLAYIVLDRTIGRWSARGGDLDSRALCDEIFFDYGLDVAEKLEGPEYRLAEIRKDLTKVIVHRVRDLCKIGVDVSRKSMAAA